ncbi:MAG: hypothetical protein OXL37_13000 [Chloroflexota bacterium]|nr:hypothetical protein [Chloroflexota bacterium]MDE2959174.1 hypothetical protein [Chloroflexota bacterium]
MAQRPGVEGWQEIGDLRSGGEPSGLGLGLAAIEGWFGASLGGALAYGLPDLPIELADIPEPDFGLGIFIR